MKMLMKEERVAENVVKIMEYSVLKKLWKDDRETFDIVVDVVKKKCNHQENSDGEVIVSADYKKVAKIANNVIKEIAEEFTKFIIRDDAAVAVVKLLNDNDLKKLTKDGDEMAMILSKAEGIIRNKVVHNDHNEEQDEELQPVDTSIVKEKVGIWRKHVGRFMHFLDNESFKKGMPKSAILGLQVMDALIANIGSDQLVEENDMPESSYCGCCVVSFEDYRYRHDMSKRADSMVKAIKSLIAQRPLGSLTRPKRADELELIPGEFVEGLESREELLQNILVALQDDSIMVVGVFGMGGSGKTMLAKEVAHKRACGLFDKRVVVEVSEIPNIKGIQNHIAGGIGLTLEDMHPVAHRARILYNKLKSEKILIILDNIWKKLKLDKVGIPYGSTKDFGCKILITTRVRHVCRDMDIQDANVFEVGLLNKREALNLFENQIEKKVGNGEYQRVAKRLLKKCGGLPLAIATTGSVLKGKNLPVWCHFAETSEKPISCQVSSEYHETYSILETSYKLIDIEEKRIFLFLACLSPLDSAVTVDDLMRYGIGLDLFQRVNNLLEAIEQASMWVNELISSSLLLKGDSDGEIKIHDLVRASAISFIDKGKDRMTLVESIPRWMRKEMFEKLTAISLMSGHDFSRLSGVKALMLEILLLKGDVSFTTLTSDFFVGMKNLKVLSLSDVDFNPALPESIGQLERLQTLHLHHCKLKDIKLIGKLVNLLILSLRESSLEELPIEIGELSNLQLLDMGGCKGVKNIPANILSRLSHLEGLYMLNCFDGWASTNIEVNDGGESNNQASGSELDTLSHLNVLEMEVSEAAQLLTVNNGQLVEQLSKFRIHVGNSFGRHMADKAEVSAFRYVLELDKIDPSQNNWLRALLKKADCLLVMQCPSLATNFVPLLEGDGFNDLRYLEVAECDFEFIVSSNEQDESMVFANLELLCLRNMSSLEMICDGKAPARMFSNLRRLFLSCLPNLKCGLPLTLVQLNLYEVSVEYCGDLVFIVNKDASVPENETNTVSFPLLKSLDLKGVQSLSKVLGPSQKKKKKQIQFLGSSLDIEELLNDDVFNDDFFNNDDVFDDFFNAESILPSLESLKLSGNEIIETLWDTACDVSGFQNLKVLHILFCRELKNLGYPSIFAALVQLEELWISNCNKLNSVIAKRNEERTTCDHVINFPLLKRLSLESLPLLETFYGGSCTLEFPNLKSLSLSDAPNFTNFDGLPGSTTLFSDKVEFPFLEELEVQGMSNMVVRLWNWYSSDVRGERESGTTSLNPIPNLQKLRLGQVYGFTYIPHILCHKLSQLIVTGFCDIKTLFSVSPSSNREVFWTYSQLPNLENLCVDSCESLEQLFENKENAAALILCERLTGITLETMPKLKILPFHLLKNIRTLSICGLSWKYVFSADLFIKGKEQLQQLESLEIFGCENMEVIIRGEIDRDGEARVYGFPHLKILELKFLDITKFASKPYIELHFPLLDSIKLYSCHKIQSFCSGPLIAPKLKEVNIRMCDNLECFLSEKMNEVRELPSLESVNIRFCSSLLSFSSEPLVVPKLHDVYLKYCPEMKWFLSGGPNQDDIMELPFLESVSIEECYDMKSFSTGGIKAHNLCELKIDEKDYSKCANEELQVLLANLSKCYIRG
ncbi:uncharacterized protein LOC141613948 isoform X2 [Silene latifolia]